MTRRRAPAAALRRGRRRAPATLEALLTEYRRDLETALRRLRPEQLVAMAGALLGAREAGATVFLMGNGGSAATPSHSAGDWAKELGVKTRCLSDNVPMVTAAANDIGYADVFTAQLRVFLSPGDVVIAYSGSGESVNVIRAVEYARRRGNYTIALTGGYRNRSGGRLSRLVDLAIVVETRSMERIEDCHLIVNHIVKEYIRTKPSRSLDRRARPWS